MLPPREGGSCPSGSSVQAAITTESKRDRPTSVRVESCGLVNLLHLVCFLDLFQRLYGRLAAGAARMSLREAYDATAAALRRHGVTPDSFRVVQQVEALREYWRPDTACVVLLAESHVATKDEDFRVESDGAILRRLGLRDYPSHFVRFVYCLAAGERSLLPAGTRPKSRSKWQFWRILWSCENDPTRRHFDLTRRATPDSDTRIAKKVRLLLALRRRGIWLLDASVIGINGLEPGLKREVTRVSWDMYVAPRIAALDSKPERIIVIGAAVAEAVFGSRAREGVWSGVPYEVVNQPQGDRSKEGARRTLTKIHELTSACK